MADLIYGLLGRSLAHSWSVPIHAALGRPDYQLFEREPEELEAFLQQETLGGVNVTIPYKQTVMAFCDEIDETAKAIGSVNTLVREDGKLCGFNTDAVGFCRMAELAGIELAGKKVLILGSGGASLTVQAMARQLGAREVAVLSRSGENNYETLPRHTDAEVIVNATPVGMFPNCGESLVDLTRFPRCTGVLDLIYNPRRTALLLQAKALGIPHSDGLPMLIEQAVAAEALFFHKPFPAAAGTTILRDMRMKNTNIVLIGMPGCGKTTVGNYLSFFTGRSIIDTDYSIEQRYGRSIPEILATDGEAAFRELEQQEVALSGQQTGIILMTGGGVVKDPRNEAALRQNGRVYQLDRKLELLATDGRPLSQSTDLSALLAEREPLYRQFRDAVIDNNGPAEVTAERIWRDFCEHFGD